LEELKLSCFILSFIKSF